MTGNSEKRVGIVGAGYISDYHLKAVDRRDDARLVAICDTNEPAARRLGHSAPQAAIYTDLDRMLSEAELDVVHILTQPDSHFFLAKKVLEAGCHAVIEKPVTASSEEAEQLKALAEEKGVQVAVNHNFVFSRPFNGLKTLLDEGRLGPIKSVRVVWRKALPQIQSGPWNLWMLREPGNILFETGSHSLSELLAVIGEQKVTVKRAAGRLPKALPSGALFYRRWNIAAEAGPIAVQIDTAFDLGYEQHSVEVEGLFGVAYCDIENDVLDVHLPTGRAYDLERLRVNTKVGLSRVYQSLRTYTSYAGAKFVKRFSGAPYETSMLNGINECYETLTGNAKRTETSVDYALSVARLAEAVRAKMPKAKAVTKGDAPSIPEVSEAPSKPATVLLIGATGFIGKRLFTALMDAGLGVRALVRNPSGLVGVTLNENSEVMVGDYRDAARSTDALQGIEVVYHLAVAHGNSLEGYLRADSDPTLAFAERCREAGIRRFIYTGTIDSLDLARDGALHESDGVDPDISRRNNYAHSKAITEGKLMALHKEQNFPLVIVRPAIVLGVGGPVTHVGVANWFGLGRCAYWGRGDNLLPIVLADDVVTALTAAASAEGIEGRTYNLSSRPCISAREYVAEVERTLECKISSKASHALGHYVGDVFKWVIKVAARHPDSARIPSLHDWRCREQHASFNTEAAERDLNWQPNGERADLVEKGIRQPARQFLDN